MQNGAFQKAMRMYTKALEIDAGNAILYSNRSAAHFNIRQFSESLEDAESAILCDANWWKAYKRKGLALIHMQRYEEAIEALEEGLKIVGKNAEMEKNLEFARACHEQAQNLYILPEAHMMRRLESVPVFIVTDSAKQPFFVTYDDGQQVCTFYFDEQDAVATLDWIKAENPSLGDTACVIHITLHQAFILAQETQKQYYEETTRAAAEEDRLAALEAEKKSKNPDIDDKKEDEDDEDEAEDAEDAGADSNVVASEAKDGGEQDDWEEDGEPQDKEKTKGEEGDKKMTALKAEDGSPSSADKMESEGVDAEKKDEDGDGDEEKKSDSQQNLDEAVIDENAPLSFQFRPELRQVQVAVDLLNKNPNPPVRPILRDPPSVRKAKAEAKAKAKAEEEEKEKAKKETEPKSKDKSDASGTAGSEEKSESSEVTATSMESKPASPNEKEETSDSMNVDSDSSPKPDGEKKTDDMLDDDDDAELTVDNFNGIPIFQAKGLTLLQKSKQLIPLFFSKWDLEAAWEQLKNTNGVDVPGECDIEVGTLEDVLRRMSESKTDEFESVFFVPSREAMKAINVEFPLDELSNSSGGRRPAGKKAELSRAKQIAARGGTKDEIRAAIREDLEKYVERQKMAEVVSQIEHARRVSRIGGVGSAFGGFTGFGTSSNTLKNNTRGTNQKNATEKDTKNRPDKKAEKASESSDAGQAAQA